ncbi:MAG: tRNA (N(6)-L-threonylcarbamoyladenosine(37)-C(2))-methylthiotransferase MtaB [Calditrichota bacterium]
MSHKSISPRTISIATLGCKLNQYESEAILSQFRSVGYEVTEDATTADVCVVNTCAVTATAERKARSLLRSLRKKNPEAQLFAVGCMAERAAETLAAIDGVDAVLGNREKEHFLDFLPRLNPRQKSPVFVGETHSAETFISVSEVDGLLGRTRAYLKIQDGCSQKCTYCIIPSLRGKGRSLPIPEVISGIEKLVHQGFAEIVLTGVALGTYGRDLNDRSDLASLLDSTASIHGLKRLRLGSVEPWAINNQLLQIIAESEIICPHLHIPLQSAEDTTLHRMNRRYTANDIRHLLDSAFTLRSDWGIGTDIIVGFPGETDAHFEATRKFLSEYPFSYLHVFPYSARPGTPATRLPDQVSPALKQERVYVLRELDRQLRTSFRQRHLGGRQQVLFENRRLGGLLAGHSANYLDVYAEADDSQIGKLCDISITGLHPDGVLGVSVN